MTPQRSLKASLDVARIHRLFDKLAQAYPDPQTELFYTNPFTLLVAVMLSAQSTDKGVNRVTETLFQTVSTPQDIVQMGQEALQDCLKTIGLYKTKAKNVVRTAHILITQHQGRVPVDREALEALPGVGRKTANVLLNVAFHQPTIPVDTHIFRLAHRLGLAVGSTPLKVERQLEEVIPVDHRPQAHLRLILHGRYTCKARTPLCHKCPLLEECPHGQQRSGHAR
jgi:endonuclease-3